MHAQDTAARGAGILFQKVVHQQRDVFPALAQRRHADRNDVQPVIKILAKNVFGNRLVEVAVGGGDHAHIDRDFTGAAHRPHGAFLQHTQQLDLHSQRHFTDLVEEDSAAVGHFKQAALVLVGSGESAFQVSEEFALEQSLGKRSAVHGNEGVGSAR